ncbi:MAG TPA: 30S ribosomal protein S8 [Candidatus Saccharimonadales bacterium]
MLSTDPVADMLTRIRNAALAGKHFVSLPHSKLKETIAKELARAHYLTDVKVTGEGVTKTIEITVHEPGTNATFTEITRVSKPGRRVYASADEIPRVKNGRGIVLVSTSKGIMTGRAARQARLGGELICKVY